MTKLKGGKHTNASLLKLLNELKDAAATLPPKELKLKQTLNGYKHVEGKFLLNHVIIVKKALRKRFLQTFNSFIRSTLF